MDALRSGQAHALEASRLRASGVCDMGATALLIALAVMAVSCVGLPATAWGADPRPQAIRIAPRGSDDPVTAVRRFKPLTDYLAREMDRPIELVLRGSYREVLDAFGRGEVDVVFGNALNFVQAKRKYGATVVAKRATDEGTKYRSLFVTLASSDVRRLEDLQGRRIAFSDPSSTSGYVVPRLMLAEVGAPDPAGFFAEIKFKGNQYDAIRAVLAGEVDAATVASFVLTDIGLEARRLRVIARSEPMELGPVFANPRALSPEAIARLRSAFLAIGAEPATKPLAATLQVRGFLPASDDDYLQIERIHAAVERLPELPYAPPPELPVQALPEGEFVSYMRLKLVAIGVLSLGLLAVAARRRVWEGLRGQFLLAFFLIILFLLVLVTAATYLKGQEVLRTDARDSAVLLSQSVLLASRKAILSHDRTFLQQYADALVRQRAVPVTAVVFHDERGRPLARSGGFEPSGLWEVDVDLLGETLVRTYASGPLGQEYFQVVVPVGLEGRTWGEIRLAVSLERMHAVIREGVLNILILGLVAALAGFGLADLQTRRIVAPLQRLVAWAHRRAQGETPDLQAGEFSGELHTLVLAVSSMTAALERTTRRPMEQEVDVAIANLITGINHGVSGLIAGVDANLHRLASRLRRGEPVEDAVQDMRRGVRLIHELISTLQGLHSRRLTLGVVTVPALLDEVARQLEGRLPASVGIRREDSPAMPEMEGDVTLLGQAILNIGINAVEAMNGRRGAVALRCRFTPPHVVVEVEDAGGGIPEEDRPHIFDLKFTTKEKGTGLGLYIAGVIIRMHHGRIDFQSELGNGTRFRVFLPLRQGTATADLAVQAGVGAPATGETLADRRS